MRKMKVTPDCVPSKTDSSGWVADPLDEKKGRQLEDDVESGVLSSGVDSDGWTCDEPGLRETKGDVYLYETRGPTGKTLLIGGRK